MSDKTAESLANASLAAEVTAHKATKYHWKQTSILASERHDRILTLEGEVLDKSGEAALYKERSETAEATIAQQKARIEELEAQLFDMRSEMNAADNERSRNYDKFSREGF